MKFVLSLLWDFETACQSVLFRNVPDACVMFVNVFLALFVFELTNH